MGICPCTRDIELRPNGEKECSQQVLVTHSTESLGSRQQSDLNISLRSEDCIIRLVAPFNSTYRIISDLGVEGPAKFVLAQYIPTNKVCLVKIIPRTNGNSKDVLKKLTHIDHPNVLKTYEVCQDSTDRFVVSEACAGGQLSDYLQAHTYLSEAEAAIVIRQVLSALAYCHHRGIVHGTLTTANIHFKESLSAESVFIKLSGFENFDLMSIRQRSALANSSAPELVDHQTISSKCDIWSSGVILYLLLSGEHPFEGRTPCSKYRGFSFPPTRWSHISQDAVSLISSMLSRKAEFRPSALQCLAHPWLAQIATVEGLRAKPITAGIASLKFEYKKSSLKKAILQFMLDRVLDDHDVTKIAEVFIMMDTNGDGVLSEDELMAAFQLILPRAEAQLEVDVILMEEDGGMRSFMTWSEFVLASYREEQLLSRENLKLTFKALDKDHSGAISANEMRMFFRINGSAGSVEQWKKLMALVDTSGDGEIDFHEFEELVTHH